MHSKAVVTGLSDTSGGAFIRNEDSGVYQPLGYVPSTLRELVQIRQTQTDAVDYVTQTTKITQAAAVAEATSAALPTVVTTDDSPSGYVSTVTPNAGGGYKPEGALAYARGTAQVETLAVWIPATKRSIADSSQLRSIINQDLRDALNELLDQEILNGNGTPGFTGVAKTPNILTQAFATDLLTSIRKGITQLSKNGEQATGIVLSPDDWETAELALAASAPYLPYTKSLWRIPVVEYSGTMTAKKGYIGNWRKAILWDREITQISISDSHADYFIRNLVAILGELRAAFAVVKPTAFVEVATQAAG
jgi:HK97 family phage major capsid protein